MKATGLECCCDTENSLVPATQDDCVVLFQIYLYPTKHAEKNILIDSVQYKQWKSRVRLLFIKRFDPKILDFRDSIAFTIFSIIIEMTRDQIDSVSN